MDQVPVLIVGASVAGLASAASLQKQGIAYVIIEKESQVATPWRNHYHRLHLHTSKNLSNLPYKAFGNEIPRYPSRVQVVDYLEQYQKEFNIRPAFNTEAIKIKREADYWVTETTNGGWYSKYLIIATGTYSKAKMMSCKGIETFPGKIVHSSDYKRGIDFRGQKVLVVGFGNSACEIAIDLYEQGASVFMSVRSPVNVIPRQLLGIPILRISQLMSKLPPRIADKITAPLTKLLFGDMTSLGLKKMPYGTFEQIQKDEKIPVIDIGIIRHIRQGHVSVFCGIEHIAGSTVYFTDGKKETFDSIITATGYYRDDAQIIEADKSRFADLKVSAGKQKCFGKDGLYFCGFWIAPTGQFREIALDAKKIAGDIAGKEKTS